MSSTNYCKNASATLQNIMLTQLQGVYSQGSVCAVNKANAGTYKAEATQTCCRLPAGIDGDCSHELAETVPCATADDADVCKTKFLGDSAFSVDDNCDLTKAVSDAAANQCSVLACDSVMQSTVTVGKS